MFQPNYLHLLKKFSLVQPKKIQKQSILPEILDLSDYKIISELGTGSYSTVYLVKELLTSKKYALKKSIANDLDEVQKIKQEILLVSSLPQANIVPIYKYLFKKLDVTTYAVYLLMPISDGDWSQEIPKRSYTQSELLNIMSQLVSTLCLFQKNGLAHRDIKPQNIFIFDNGKKYTLGDFDEIIKIPPGNYEKKEYDIKGTEMFMSPLLYTAAKEGAYHVKHNVFKSDVYSLGLCLIYAITKNYDLVNYIKKSNDYMNVKILSKYFNKYGYDYSNELMNIIFKMIRKEERDRYDFVELNKVIESLH